MVHLCRCYSKLRRPAQRADPSGQTLYEALVIARIRAFSECRWLAQQHAKTTALIELRRDQYRQRTGRELISSGNRALPEMECR
jgi:hypothetical protein